MTTATAELIATWVGEVLHNGPTRVLTHEDGEGMPPWRAARDLGIYPDVIFIRDDGWSLGAPLGMEQAAARLWDGHWVAKLERVPDNHGGSSWVRREV